MLLHLYFLFSFFFKGGDLIQGAFEFLFIYLFWCKRFFICPVYFCFLKIFKKKINFFYFKLNVFSIFRYFNVLMLKIIFKN
jgi:hypothetical protein